MRSKNTIEIIIHDIKELERIAQGFTAYTKVPQIEVDIMKHKIQNLQDFISMFEGYNSDLPEEKEMALGRIESAVDNIAGDLEVSEEHLFDYEKKAVEKNIIAPAPKSKKAAIIPAEVIKEEKPEPVEKKKVIVEEVESPVSKTVEEKKEIVKEVKAPVPEPKEEVKEEPIISEDISEKEIIEEKEPKPEEEEVELDEIAVVPSFLNAPEEIPVVEEKETIIEPKKEAVPVEAKEVLGEKLQGDKKFVNEKIGGVKTKDISSKIKIADLNKAIPLNDKFMFIRELFGGNADLFKSCVQEINEMNDFDAAFAYLLEKTEVNWEEEASAQHFLSILRRKF